MTTITESKCGVTKIDPTEAGHYVRLEQRMNWLTLRAEAKAKNGWDNTYDLSERDALKWALEKLDG